MMPDCNETLNNNSLLAAAGVKYWTNSSVVQAISGSDASDMSFQVVKNSILRTLGDVASTIAS